MFTRNGRFTPGYLQEIYASIDGLKAHEELEKIMPYDHDWPAIPSEFIIDSCGASPEQIMVGIFTDAPLASYFTQDFTGHFHRFYVLVGIHFDEDLDYLGTIDCIRMMNFVADYKDTISIEAARWILTASAKKHAPHLGAKRLMALYFRSKGDADPIKTESLNLEFTEEEKSSMVDIRTKIKRELKKPDREFLALAVLLDGEILYSESTNIYRDLQNLALLHGCKSAHYDYAWWCTILSLPRELFTDNVITYAKKEFVEKYPVDTEFHMNNMGGPKSLKTSHFIDLTIEQSGNIVGQLIKHVEINLLNFVKGKASPEIEVGVWYKSALKKVKRSASPLGSDIPERFEEAKRILANIIRRKIEYLHRE